MVHYEEKLQEKLQKGKWKEEKTGIERFLKYYKVTFWRMVKRKLPLFLPGYVGGGIKREDQ